MDKQVYIISSNGLEYWKLQALLVGPEGIEIKSLYEQFMQAFSYPIPYEYHAQYEADDRARAAGLIGDYSSQLFADWLIKKQGFQQLAFWEVNFDDYGDSGVHFEYESRILLLPE